MQVFAQNEEQISSKGFFSTLGDEVASPWTTDARPWLIAGTVGTAFLVLFEDFIDDPTQDEFVEHKPLGRLSVVGDYGGKLVPNLLYSIGMYSHYLLSADEKSQQRSLLMMKATLYSTTLTTTLKPIVREPRPNGNDNLSFPSGHTTAAFAFSSYVIAEHSFWPWGAGALLLSSLTAASRINDNAHYLHDVFGGATIGTIYGLGMHYLYSKPSTTAKLKDEMELLFVPAFEPTYKGALVVVSF